MIFIISIFLEQLNNTPLKINNSILADCVRDICWNIGSMVCYDMNDYFLFDGS